MVSFEKHALCCSVTPVQSQALHELLCHFVQTEVRSFGSKVTIMAPVHPLDPSHYLPYDLLLWPELFEPSTWPAQVKAALSNVQVNPGHLCVLFVPFSLLGMDFWNREMYLTFLTLDFVLSPNFKLCSECLPSCLDNSSSSVYRARSCTDSF